MTSKLTRRAPHGVRMKPLATALVLTMLTGLTVSAATLTSQVPQLPETMAHATAGGTLNLSPGSTVERYTVVLREAPVASYAGEIPGLAAPVRRSANGGRNKLDLQAPATTAYIEHLVNRQNAFINELNASLGRQVQVTARMQHALNAVIVEMTGTEALKVARRSDVMIVEREVMQELHTDAGPSFINAPAVWSGNTSSGAATNGEGIIVGIIDTGINWASPAFAGVSPADSYAHVNPRGAGNYLGLCVAPFLDVGRCNDKLIGIYNFTSTSATRTGTDTNGHGSHTASTVAGNRWTATFANGPFAISGVAPRANVISYLACTSTGCATTATTQSVNQAVADGVDALNYSISGGTSPWTDTTSVAFRNAVAAGMFVSASAGNTSTTIPDPQGQVNHMEPWVHTVAASTQNRVIAMSLDLTSESSPPANTQDIPLRPGAAPLPTTNLVNVPLIKSPNFADGANDGCAAYPANTFVRAPGLPFASGFEDGETPQPSVGGVAVLRLDGNTSACGSGARRTAALNAGAVGVIFVDTGFLNLGASGTSWAMRLSDWNNLEAGSNPATATVTIDVNSISFPSQGDRVANFSFRGPRLVNGQGMVKPDVTAPGVDILAVGAASIVGDNGVYLNNGTSMSSPHNAGAGALLAALHPSWTPSQIKSALSLSSNNTGSVNEDGTPVRLWDYGSGRINLAKAAKVGLIMDESIANYVAANPAAGGDISTLNLPSIARNNVVGTATFTRTFTRARLGARTYDLSTSGFPAGALSVSPTSFTIPEGGSQSITVTVVSGLLTSGQWTLGEVSLTPTSGDEPVLHLPVAMFPGGPAIAVSPTSLTASSNSSISNDLTISNTANPTLNWSVQTTGTATVIPFNTTSTTNGQLAGSYISPTRGFHWSQNFDVAAPMRVTTLRANGFTLPGTTPLSTTNTPSITFSVYANNAGAPAGAPGGFGAAPLWTFTGAISAANGITTTGGAVSLNLNATNVVGTPLNLAPGRYWMTVTPTTNSSAAQTAANPLWAWFVSADAQVGNVPKLYAPHADPAAFQPDNPAVTMLSGFVDGVVNCTLPAWVGLTTTSGALGFAGSQTIPVVFNATGLSKGTYTGNLCISSNATNAAVVPVPLTFTVTGGAPPVAPTLGKAFAPTSVETGTASTLTLTLTNGDPAASTLSANLVDNLPTGLVVAATPNASTTCASGTVTAAAGSGTVSLGSGAVIPANGACTVTVSVSSGVADTYTNTIAAGALQTSTGNNASPASAQLVVTPAAPLACTTGSAIEVVATAGTPGPTGYTTLKDAFDAVNAGTHQGNLDLSVCGNTTETAPALLNASGVGAALYSQMAIKPANGAARTISGAIAAGSPLIDLVGADNVTIDGLNTGGNALTISNTTVSGTSGTSTIRFIGGATNNTITRTTLLGSANMPLGTNGGTVYFATDALTPDGNDNNTLSGNVIGPGPGGLPTKAVYGNGSTTNIGIANSGVVITNNDILDFFSPSTSVSGIHVLNGNTLWTISNNRIFQTAPRVFTTAALRYAGITLNSAGSAALRGQHTVTGNRIGFANAAGTGVTDISGSTNTFRGIDVINVHNTDISLIQNNVISGIVQSTANTGTSTTTPFIGIMLGSTDGRLDAIGNTIGSLDGSSTITVNASAGNGTIIGIYNFSSFATTINNNVVGSITVQGTGTTNGFRGIHVFTGNAVTANVEGNTVANISNLQSGGNATYAIQTQLAGVTVRDNTVRNISSNGNAASVVLGGLSISAGTATTPNIISRNVVHSLHNTVTGGAAGAIYAVDLTLGAQANVVERNNVHSVSVTTSLANYQVWGMILRGTSPSTAIVKNNMIRLGLNAAGAPLTTSLSLVGIRDSAGTNVAHQFYHNSVYIGGTGVDAGSANTFAFNSNTVTTARNFQNNIFWNARSNATGGGSAHIAITLAGAAPNPAGTTSSHNVLLANGTDGVLGVFNAAITPTLADWQLATGLDATSVAADPRFIAPNGNATTGDLHISPSLPTPVEAAGLAIADVTDDFDGDARAGLSPTDIGADAGNFIAPARRRD